MHSAPVKDSTSTLPTYDTLQAELLSTTKLEFVAIVGYLRPAPTVLVRQRCAQGSLLGRSLAAGVSPEAPRE